MVLPFFIQPENAKKIANLFQTDNELAVNIYDEEQFNNKPLWSADTEHIISNFRTKALTDHCVTLGTVKRKIDILFDYYYSVTSTGKLNSYRNVATFPESYVWEPQNALFLDTSSKECSCVNEQCESLYNIIIDVRIMPVPVQEIIQFFLPLSEGKYKHKLIATHFKFNACDVQQLQQHAIKWVYLGHEFTKFVNEEFKKPGVPDLLF